MSVFAEVLAIEVGLKGVETVLRGVEQITEKFHMAEEAARQMATGFKEVGVSVGLAIGGIREAAVDQTALAMLRGINDNLAESQTAMEEVDRISAQGVFHKDELIRVAEILDRAIPGAFEKNIDLVTKLGARMGDVTKSADIVGRLLQGSTIGVAMELRAAGIGPDKLRAAGIAVQGRTIESSPQAVLQALKAIEDHDRTYSYLQETFNAEWQDLIFEVTDLVKTLGEPILGPLRWVISLLSTLTGWLKEVNKHTDGVLGVLILIGLLGLGIKNIIVPLWDLFGSASAAAKALVGLADAATAAAAAQDADAVGGVAAGAAGGGFIAGAWSKVKSAIEAVGDFLWYSVVPFLVDTLLPILEGLLTFVLLPLAAALGVWKLIDLIGGKDTMGDTWKQIHGVNPYTNKPYKAGSERPQGNQSDKPWRRDDAENLYKRQYGEAFTG